MTKRARSLEFDPSAFEDLSWWIKEDRKTAKCIAVSDGVMLFAADVEHGGLRDRVFVSVRSAASVLAKPAGSGKPTSSKVNP